MGLQIKFPYLQPWQKVVFDSVSKDTEGKTYVVKARRQCGKSIMAIAVLLYFAFKERSTGIVVEPTLSQCRRVFKQMVQALGGETSKAIKSANATLLTIEFRNGSEILFKSAEQGEALRGMTVKKSVLVIDEAAFIPTDIIEILTPCTDANKAPILFISTPLFMNGAFYDMFIEGTRGNKNVISFDWSTFDTSVYLSPEKLEYYKKTISPLKFKSEYLGEFLSGGSFLFGDLDKKKGDWSNKEPVYGGIDWSVGENNDNTILTLLDEYGQLVKILCYNNLTPTEIVESLCSVINGLNLRCVEVEMNSIGSVYCDMLKQKVKEGVYIEEFDTTNESKRRIIESLITDVQTDDLPIPPDLELVNEMQHYNMQKTKTGITYNGEGARDDRVMSLAFARDAWKNNLGAFSISFV